jgi:hypothetical protein
MEDFYSKLNMFKEFVKTHEKFRGLLATEIANCSITSDSDCASYSFSIKGQTCVKKCTYTFSLSVKKKSLSEFDAHFLSGLIKSSAFHLWSLPLDVKMMPPHGDEIVYQVTLRTTSNRHIRFMNGIDLNHDSNCLNISLDTYRGMFPFTLFIDRSLNIVQAGNGFLKRIGPKLKDGDNNLFDFFLVLSPKLESHSFEALAENENRSAILQIVDKDPLISSLQFKGSFIYLSGKDLMFFTGSPLVSSLEDLTKYKMYISDIPIHDATRDIILMSEQTRAQVKIQYNFLLKKLLDIFMLVEIF